MRYRPIEERFAEKFEADPVTGCWNWTGSICRGYPYIRNERGEEPETGLATHYAYERSNGPIPAGMLIRHSCHNPRCVNLDHLLLGTHADNMRDMAEAGRRQGVSPSKRTYLADGERTAVVLSRSQGETVSELARRYGVDRKTIRNITAGRETGLPQPQN